MADLDLYEDLYGDVDTGNDAPIDVDAAASPNLGEASGSTFPKPLTGWETAPPPPTTFSIATYEDSVGASHQYKPAPNQPPRDGPFGGGGGGGACSGSGGGYGGGGGGGAPRSGPDIPDEGYVAVETDVLPSARCLQSPPVPPRKTGR